MIGKCGHVQFQSLGFVCHQHADAARHRHEAQPAALHHRRRFRAGIGHIEHFIDRLRPVDAVLPEGRVIDRVGPRQRSGVRLRGLGTDGAASDLHHDHRLFPGARQFQRLDQPVAVGRAFKVSHDHAGLVILRAIGHGIGKIDIAGIARRRPEVDPQAAHPDQRHAIRPESAALADDRHAAGFGQVLFDARRKGRVKVVADVGDAKAVRPDQPHTALARDVDHARLKCGTFVIDLGEPRTEDHRAPHTTRRAIRDRLNRQRRGQRDHRQIRGRRRLGDRRIGRQTLNLGRPRIDRQDRALEPVTYEKIHRPSADALGVT